MTDKILRCREVQQAIGLSRSTIYRMVERGDFPRPQKLGLRAIGWRQSAISDWMEARLVSELKVTSEYAERFFTYA